jgi:tRNA G18 (ribose-2'-O)-methylase SpoU
VALVPAGGTPLPELQLEGDAVLVLGAEREGLPADVLAGCDEQASIPQPGGGESLNVAMAGAIALYELARGKQD